MKKLVIVSLVIVFLAMMATFVFAETPTIDASKMALDTNPTFYGQYHGYVWMYWNNSQVNTNNKGYADYQNLNDFTTGFLTFDYNSTDGNGVKWWKSSFVGFCGNFNFYNAYIATRSANNIPFTVNSFCSFLPMIKK